MRFFSAFAMFCLALCAACSLEPETQPPGLLVATTPPGASCLLTRQGQTIASVSPTPVIARGLDDGSGAVTIACTRPGFARTVVNLTPSGAAYPERVDIALAPAPPGMPPPAPPPPPR